MSNIELKKVLIALDYDDESAALEFVSQLSPNECRLKVGKEMFTYFGPQFVKKLVDLGFDVFLDLKFHDIPNTVAKAVTAAAELGVWMVNVHASGGTEMMSKAKEALAQYGDKAPLLIAVTVLTSMDQAQLSKLGVEKTPQEQVLYLAKLAKEAGLDGVVCSAQEAESLKAELGEEFKLITPGIRPAGSDAGDQKRIMTPEKAIAAGSDYLVVGRPITKAEDPAQALRAINTSIA
ncbi:orotidine-5'-phosphate decarboxylase [Pseudoalteromonas luteoviolacea]|uniref:Orotidine 5'-phosphate decarboxylase n=1 Tax=Pseudoalteromonas luteoviolacea NCIMB 1942 TaxID=1365253 RepID=A0A167EN77_9GAMM|nr:orotidine-5'-phosphate decarboxylase [Pseudoalteromonas luteoviolacea]KZN50991.1 orotidine 5'-phosphate decarboxylase [Pseudoalteromonas luteoviolacea NCIMB 1942]KZX01906.1 orotidine 5'-phosphate decarboxylase [Pseudoalteromonas luteoviolacea]